MHAERLSRYLARVPLGGYFSSIHNHSAYALIERDKSAKTAG